ncbi:unnamed protein product [Paramecium pentaurelia]|uniref:Uncharacterized protein n=1 Tax=Paramecium pentaurelia TaxID=43138 RepID=A0A8S1U266_9CILI|nr:unnamed protein product [Paramecium pentaurelia]
MHCFTYFHENFYLQQQYIQQQMLMYNQMLNACAFQNQLFQSTNNQLPNQAEFLYSQLSKNEDTPLIQAKVNIPKKKKIIRAPKQQQDGVNDQNKTSKKKVFLSMLDIKEVQYKKSKVSDAQVLQKTTNLLNEENQ